MPVCIQSVEQGSPAEQAGLVGGMWLLALDGHEINDGLDYEFYAAAQNPVALVRQDGKESRVQLQKEEQEPLGCVFETYLIDKQHHCKNKCVFCFIDQLPAGMRKSLYFKDDDERLGFLFGNYITLTNLTHREVERIIEMRISPVNVSVHTTNPALRVQMMGNPKAGEVLSYLPELAEAGIQLNTQLVLCPGLNDGEELKSSIEWLGRLYPAMQSVAAVPVGLTKHRQGCHPLRPYTKEEAKVQLEIMLAAGESFLSQHGERLVFPSDEWFLQAEEPIPPADFYEGYPQLENGVGMWRLFHDEFMQALDETDETSGAYALDCVSGVLAAPLMEMLSRAARQKLPGARLHVHAVENEFFGPEITVSGLLTGQDIVRQLAGRLHSGHLVLPATVLRAGEDVLLDDMSCAQLEEALGVQVHLSDGSGEGLLELLLACQE